jgi:hypothetical protein
VQEYLCQRLHELPEAALEKFLLQLVYIAVDRPSSNLEDAIVDFCSKSFRIAVKVRPAADVRIKPPGPGPQQPAELRAPQVGRSPELTPPPLPVGALQTYWLLLALHQDHPKNKHIELFKDKCERSALEGHWVRRSRRTRCPAAARRGRAFRPLARLRCWRLRAPPLQPCHLPRFPPPPNKAPYCCLQEVPFKDPRLEPVSPMPVSPSMNSPLASALASTYSAYSPQHSQVGGTSSWLGTLQEQLQEAASSAASSRRASRSNHSFGSVVELAATASNSNNTIITIAAPECAVDRQLSVRTSSRGSQADAAAVDVAWEQPSPPPPPRSPQQQQQQLSPELLYQLSRTPSGTVGRRQALQLELGQGEGVSELLERAKRGGLVSANEEAHVPELDHTRPLSPLTKLRCGACAGSLRGFPAWLASSCTARPCERASHSC